MDFNGENHFDGRVQYRMALRGIAGRGRDTAILEEAIFLPLSKFTNLFALCMSLIPSDAFLRI